MKNHNTKELIEEKKEEKKQFHKKKQSAEKLFYLLIFGISGIQKSLVQNDSESRGGGNNLSVIQEEDVT